MFMDTEENRVNWLSRTHMCVYDSAISVDLSDGLHVSSRSLFIELSNEEKRTFDV